MCMKNSRFSANICSITARSSPFGQPFSFIPHQRRQTRLFYTISTAPFNTQMSRLRSALYTRPLKRDIVCHASVVVFTTRIDDDMQKINRAKVTFWILYSDTSKDIATKSGETHVQDVAVTSCKFSRQLVQDICPQVPPKGRLCVHDRYVPSCKI